MKIIGVGDNVVDCYIDHGTYFPGGNAVNVAVNCKRFGASDSSYIGVFGDDEPADHIKECLKLENVDFSYSRKVYAGSGKPGVKHTSDGDRVFVPGPKDSAQHMFRLNLTQKDYDYISTFDVCHSSIYSNVDHELENISKVCKVSFDFSDDFSMEYVEKVIKNVNFAFFSGSECDEDTIEKIINMATSYGVEVIGITLGSKGALFVHQGKRYTQQIKPIDVVDTMGAGDGFIAGFLTNYINTSNIVLALDYAAECAATCCSYYGGIGYPHKL